MNIIEVLMDAAVTAQVELWDCQAELFQRIAAQLNVDELTDNEQFKIEEAIKAAALAESRGAMHINDTIRIIKKGRE